MNLIPIRHRSDNVTAVTLQYQNQFKRSHIATITIQVSERYYVTTAPSSSPMHLQHVSAINEHQVSTKKYYFQPLKSPPKTKISSINSEKGRKRKLNKKWVLNHNKWENSNYNRENQIEVCNAGRNGSLRLALSLDNRRKWRPSSGFLQTNEELSLSLSLSLKKRLLSISYKQ